VDVTHHDITYCVTYRVRGQRVIVLRVRDTRQAGAWMSAHGYFDRAAAAWDETVGDAGVVAIAVRAEPDC
jgi:hypothetical protein